MVDEIGTTKEVAAVSTIAQRGVAMIGSAHGESLRAVLDNPDLNHLVGGTMTVILSSEELRQRTHGGNQATGARGGTQIDMRKSRTERTHPPVFPVVLELLERNRWRLHRQVARSVDAMLADQPIQYEERWLDKATGHFNAMFASSAPQTGGAGDRWLDDLVQEAVPDGRHLR